MSEEKPGYWWCAECREEIDGAQVTFSEMHQSCGRPVEWVEPTDPIADLRSSNAALKAENEALKKKAYEQTTRHCPECGSNRWEHGSGMEKSHRFCLDCGQEWFTDIAYKSVPGYFTANAALKQEVESLKVCVGQRNDSLSDLQNSFGEVCEELKRFKDWQPSDPGTKGAMEYATGWACGPEKEPVANLVRAAHAIARALRAAMVRLEDAEKKDVYCDDCIVCAVHYPASLKSQVAAQAQEIKALRSELDIKMPLSKAEEVLAETLVELHAKNQEIKTMREKLEVENKKYHEQSRLRYDQEQIVAALTARLEEAEKEAQGLAAQLQDAHKPGFSHWKARAEAAESAQERAEQFALQDRLAKDAAESQVAALTASLAELRERIAELEARDGIIYVAPVEKKCGGYWHKFADNIGSGGTCQLLEGHEGDCAPVESKPKEGA